MLRNPWRIAPIFLASLGGLIAACAVVRAEPVAAASSAGADCLAKPNAPAASGNHWYYRIDRASGRHCWYQRPESGASSEAAQSRVPSRATASPPADNPLPEPSADMRSEAGDQDTAPPAAATTAPPAQPYSWSTAAPPPAPPEQMTAPASDSASPAQAIPAQPDSVVAPPRAEPAAPIRAQVPERPAAVVEDGTHMPAIFGAGLALLIIVLGSIVARLGAKLVRSRRRTSPARDYASIVPPPILHAQDAPGLVPPMPHEGDITRAPRPPRRAPAARQDRPKPGDESAARERTRELEQNVRDLLRRMRNDQPAAARTSVAPETPRQPPSAQELDQVLAMWREGRRRPAG